MTTFSEFFKNLGSELVTFFEGTVTAEVQAAVPEVEAAATNLTVEEAEAFASGQGAQAGAIAAKVATTAAASLEAKGITVGLNSLLTATGITAPNAPALVAAKPTT